MITFEPATKAGAKARIALTGPPGSGKTYTALALAFGLGRNVVVVDTERGTASKYAGLNGWEFQRLNVHSYSPQSLVEILGAAAGQGFEVLILDSWSHYWEGIDGMLEQVDRRSGANKFTSGWKEMRPEERRMVDALLAFPGHLIVTLRSKVEYVIVENERGKKEPRKVGLKPIQREGVEYEFDLVGDLDLDNKMTVSKTRMPELARRIIPEPGTELGEQIKAWLDDGVARPTVAEYRDRALAAGQTYTALLELYREIERDGMIGAPTTAADGSPAILGELIRSRGLAAKESQAVAK